jgi:quercetin dioxygenase-like cupin family protein
VPGRRSFFTYRDLGVMAASGGKLRAQTMTAITGMTEPTGWHFHTCEGQFVYALKGWVDLEFETGETIHLKAGESLYIPGFLKHNEIATSDDLEILELSVPGEMGTVPCDKPAA